MKAVFVVVSILGTVWTIGHFTSGNLSLMLFGLAGWSVVIMLLSWFLSSLSRYQNHLDQMSRNQYKQRQSRHQPYSQILKQPSVPLDGPTVRKRYG